MDSSTIHEEDNLSRQKSEQKKSPRLTSSSKPFKKSFFLVATLWRFSWLCKTCNSSYLDYQFTSTTEPVAKHLVPRTFTLAYMEREVLYYWSEKRSGCQIYLYEGSSRRHKRQETGWSAKKVPEEESSHIHGLNDSNIHVAKQSLLLKCDVRRSSI